MITVIFFFKRKMRRMFDKNQQNKKRFSKDSRVPIWDICIILMLQILTGELEVVDRRGQRRWKSPFFLYQECNFICRNGSNNTACKNKILSKISLKIIHYCEQVQASFNCFIFNGALINGEELVNIFKIFERKLELNVPFCKTFLLTQIFKKFWNEFVSFADLAVIVVHVVLFKIYSNLPQDGYILCTG